MLYFNGTPDVVGPFDRKAVGIKWGSGATANSADYFASGVYQTVADPQCTAVSAAQSLNTFCTLTAIKDTRSGQVVLQNPLPGRRGSLGQRALEVPGIWRFDANMQKALKLSESKTLEFRIDGSDILNHAEPGTPNLNIDTSTTKFGQVTGAAAKSTMHRQFQAQLRLRF
jgi:hypothetical protein